MRVKRKITLIQILFLCVFVVCGSLVVKYNYDKSKTEKEMTSLQKEVDMGDEEEYIPSNLETGEETGAENAPVIPTEEPRTEDGMLLRYRNLYEKNNDMVGWIKVYDTVIDYPVMYNSESNSYYLHRNFDKKSSSAGIPFLDYQCDRVGNCDNMIVYAHNMRNGTMFHQLLKYSDATFFKNHKYISFDTMYNRCIYEVFAVFRTAVGSSDEFKYGQFVDSTSEDEYNKFVADCIDRSIYKNGVHPSYREKLLTLSTCSYSRTNERFVVVARLLEKR